MTSRTESDTFTVTDGQGDAFALAVGYGGAATLKAFGSDNEDEPAEVWVNLTEKDMRDFVAFVLDRFGHLVPARDAAPVSETSAEAIVTRLKAARNVLRVLGDYSNSEDLLDYILTGNA